MSAVLPVVEGVVVSAVSTLRKRGGRRAPAQSTALARIAIELAAEGLGGAARLTAWAQECPENERAFWVLLYPRLLPVQQLGPSAGTPLIPEGGVTFHVHQQPDSENRT